MSDRFYGYKPLSDMISTDGSFEQLPLTSVGNKIDPNIAPEIFNNNTDEYQNYIPYDAEVVVFGYDDVGVKDDAKEGEGAEKQGY